MRVFVEVIQRASCLSLRCRVTFGVDQFSFGTTEPFRRAISRVRRAVIFAKGSGCYWSTWSNWRYRFVSFYIIVAIDFLNLGYQTCRISRVKSVAVEATLQG